MESNEIIRTNEDYQKATKDNKLKLELENTEFDYGHNVDTKEIDFDI